MNALRRLFGRANPAAELARMGHEQRRKRILEQTRQMRRQLGLPTDPRLGS